MATTPFLPGVNTLVHSVPYNQLAYPIRLPCSCIQCRDMWLKFYPGSQLIYVPLPVIRLDIVKTEPVIKKHEITLYEEETNEEETKKPLLDNIQRVYPVFKVAFNPLKQQVASSKIHFEKTTSCIKIDPLFPIEEGLFICISLMYQANDEELPVPIKGIYPVSRTMKSHEDTIFPINLPSIKSIKRQIPWKEDGNFYLLIRSENPSFEYTTSKFEIVSRVSFLCDDVRKKRKL